MSTIKTDFGTGGANLTPQGSSGEPSLAEALRDIAEDLRAAAIAATLSTPATRKSANGPFNLAGGGTLEVTVGGLAQVVTFEDADFANPAAATDVEVVAVLNHETRGLKHARAASVAGPAVEIYSEAVGAASALNVTGGTVNAVLSFTTGVVNGTGLDILTIKGL
jgi:hypothetical protein